MRITTDQGVSFEFDLGACTLYVRLTERVQLEHPRGSGKTVPNETTMDLEYESPSEEVVRVILGDAAARAIGLRVPEVEQTAPCPTCKDDGKPGYVREYDPLYVPCPTCHGYCRNEAKEA